jgi:hypothetical protein
MNNTIDLIGIHKLGNDASEMSKLVTAIHSIFEPIYLEYEKWDLTSQSTPSYDIDTESWAGEIGPDDKLCVFMSAITPIFPF